MQGTKKYNALKGYLNAIAKNILIFMIWIPRLILINNMCCTIEIILILTRHSNTSK